MDWDDLQHFLAIARHGTLSAAARALKVTQSTMSRRLEALEARMGARLLNKTPSGYVLTAVGEAVLGNVERIENEALAVERTITGKDVRLEGSVRITAVETFAVIVLTPIFAAFRERYPGIAIELVVDTRALSLSKREADIALRMARPKQHDLVARKVAESASAIYANAAYLERRGRPDFAAGAPGHDIITVEPDLAGLTEVEWFAGLTRRASVALRSNTRFAHRAAAELGIGMACLARYLGDPSPALLRLDAPTQPPERDIWMVVHEDIRHTPRIRAVTEFLAAALKQTASRLNPRSDPRLAGVDDA
jgi:DNA-binding transcriptional LysR family regulator